MVDIENQLLQNENAAGVCNEISNSLSTRANKGLNQGTGESLAA